ERRLEVKSIVIDHPDVNVISNAAGVWNFSTLGAKTESAPPPAATSSPSTNLTGLSVDLVRITNGRFSLKLAGDQKAQVIEDIDIDLKNISMSTPVAFLVTAKRAEGGSIRIEGKAGPLDAKAAHPPAEATFSVPKLDVVKSGLIPASAGLST